MKIKTTLDINVKMGGATGAGTGLQGYLPNGTRYADLVNVFGEPQFGESQDGKVKVLWVGRIAGLVFTIYDYKSYVAPGANTSWHIGGKFALVTDLVNAYFECRNR